MGKLSLETLYDTKQASNDPFEQENSNTRQIMALIMTQTELVREILTDKQKDVVRYVILENKTQKETARILGVNKATVSITLKVAIKKLRSYLSFCDMAIKFYEQLGDD